MDLLGQTSLLVAITGIAIGFSVLARNVRNKLFLMFSILTTLISAWALFFFLARYWNSAGWYRAHLLANLWMAPAALAFIRTMVMMEDFFSRALLVFSVIAAAALSVLMFFGFQKDPLILQLIYFCPAVVVVQLAQLVTYDGFSSRAQDREHPAAIAESGRRNLIYLGGLLVLSTSVMDHIPWIGTVIPSIGNVALTAYLFFLSLAILQQKLLNFGAIFSRFLVLLSIAFTLTLVYSTIFAFIEGKPALFFLNSFIVSFLLMMLLEPIRAMVGYLTQRLLTQKYQKLQLTIRDAQRKLAVITDQDHLFELVLEMTRDLLQPRSAMIYVLQGDGTRFRQPSGKAPSGEILVNHPLIERCRRLSSRHRLPILLQDVLQNEIDRSASRKQREEYAGLIEGLRALGGNLLIPLMDREQVLGFIIADAPTPPGPWGNNWGLLPEIYPYFEQAARTMRNLEIFAQLREKERLAALGEMAAGLAHEIRNPLGAIKGAAQFLEPSSEEEARPESRFLRIIIEETDRLNRVVTQFLDYSKPFSAELKPVDLGALVEKTIELMRPTMPGAVQLRYEPPRGGAVSVLGSTEQLRQVLINLIQNGVKASQGREGAVIRVALEKTRGSIPEAVISVEDNGHGIKKEHLDKLFIPFFTTSPSGTGLGLSISQKIIEAHQGRIEVASEEGRFARFSIVVPSERD